MSEIVLMWVGIAILLATVYLLIKRYDTRTVLIGSGLLMCIIALNPLGAFDAFTKQMTNGGLIQSICSSMGFAFVMKYTRCDAHLVKLMTSFMAKLGLLLVPLTVFITFFISIAIPSAAGVSAAVGATLIPLLIASRIHPAIAAASIISGTLGAVLSPGVAHNVQIAGYAHLEVMDFVLLHAPIALICCAIGAVSLTFVTLLRKEYKLSPEAISQAQEFKVGANLQQNSDFKPNVIYALMPFVPVILLVASSFGFLGQVKLTVPASMLSGSILALLITRSDPKSVTNEFFNGMGSAYASILGIIIAAAVFIEGLTACGLIQRFIDLLIAEPEFARWGGSLGPFIMGAVTGTGDATAFAFNQAVTSQAETIGLVPSHLGSGAMYSAILGRNMSPLAGAAIVCAGLAGINPIEIIKRTAPGMILGMLFIALFWIV